MNVREKLTIRILLLIARIAGASLPEEIRKDIKQLDTQIALYIKDQ